MFLAVSVQWCIPNSLSQRWKDLGVGSPFKNRNRILPFLFMRREQTHSCSNEWWLSLLYSCLRSLLYSCLRKAWKQHRELSLSSSGAGSALGLGWQGRAVLPSLPWLHPYPCLSHFRWLLRGCICCNSTMVLEHGCRLGGHLPSYHAYGKLGCISTHYELSRDTPACCCEAVPILGGQYFFPMVTRCRYFRWSDHPCLQCIQSWGGQGS